ncbi:MAG: gliding motility-associated C-terminal domain-containing protein [Bacteroidota bacterium]
MIKKILPFILSHLFLFVSCTAEAQTNNFQCTPQIIGTGLLPVATPCTTNGTFTYGPPVTVIGNTISATSDPLSGAITSCYSGATPLKDVWFQFSPSETHVEIIITGQGSTKLTDPYIAIYESLSGECVGLMPRDCFRGTGPGPHVVTFGPLTFGVKYHLQVASTTTNGNGAFDLSIKSKNVCADCLKNSILQCYPLPVQASYPPDTTVGFCYSVIGYKEQFGNRIHGVVPTFGSGWDVSTLKIISVADSADLKGEWKWFNNIDVKGTKVNGFFYDIGKNNNPTDNLGDEGNFATIWTFCFTIKTKAPCVLGPDNLGILFNTFSDNESGSLVTTRDCSGDKDYTFKAHMQCCPKPLYVIPTPTNCNDSPKGKIEAFGGVSLLAWTYELYNSKGIKIDMETIPVSLPVIPYLNDTLTEGNYYLYITNTQSGSCTTPLHTYVSGPADYYFQQTAFGCDSSCANTMKLVDNRGNIIAHKWSNGNTTATATGLCPGQWHYDTLTIASSTCKIVDSTYIFNFGNATPQFNYTKKIYCTSDEFATISNFPATTGGTFSIVFDTISATINPNNGTIPLTGLTKGGRLIIKYTPGPPCISSFSTDTIFINISPSPVSIYSNKSLCVGDPLPTFTNISNTNYIKWYSDSTLTNLKFTQPPANIYNPLGGSIPLPTNTYYVTQTFSTASLCQSVPIRLTITVHPIPLVDAGRNQTICPGFGVNLIATGADTYNWQPPGLLNDPLSGNPIASPAITTSFTVTGTTAGCSSSDTVTIFVSATGKCNIIAYNGFTPNGDNHNDYWFIDGISADVNNHVSIFNRWGEKIWETKHYDNQQYKWEGQGPTGNIVPDGTYFYLIQYKGETLKGWVELTR